mmetsp:Transcript_5802/g.36020  ORF Transcript_5802/g.36020 Transcript_5802/m.36020 type:complete len:90 (-) Transcript_5802:201-470(-)
MGGIAVSNQRPAFPGLAVQVGFQCCVFQSEPRLFPDDDQLCIFDGLFCSSWNTAYKLKLVDGLFVELSNVAFFIWSSSAVCSIRQHLVM